MASEPVAGTAPGAWDKRVTHSGDVLLSLLHHLQEVGEAKQQRLLVLSISYWLPFSPSVPHPRQCAPDLLQPLQADPSCGHLQPSCSWVSWEQRWRQQDLERRVNQGRVCGIRELTMQTFQVSSDSIPALEG